MGKRNQIWAMCACNLYSMTAGSTLAWSSHGLKYLFDDDHSPIGRAVSVTEASFIASALPLAAAVGTPLAYLLSQFIGAKYTIITSSCLFVIGWVVMATTATLVQTIIARAVWGISVGAVYNSNRLYISQIAEDDIKEMLEMFHQFFVICGLTFTYILSPSSNFQTFCYFAIVIPLCNIIFFIWFPESPEEYISTGDDGKAKQCLMFLRRQTEEQVIDELNQLKKAVNERAARRTSMYVAVQAPSKHKKCLCFMINICMALPLTGDHVFVFFTEIIFGLTGGRYTSDAYAILFGLSSLFAGFFGMITIKIMNQKKVLMASNLGMSICMAGLGGYFTAARYYDLKVHGGFAVALVILYSIFYSLGYGTIVWSLICEHFSSPKDIFPSIVMSVMWLMIFVEVSMFLPLLPKIGPDSLCYASSGLSIYLFLIVAIFFPSPTDWESVFNANLARQ